MTQVWHKPVNTRQRVPRNQSKPSLNLSTVGENSVKTQLFRYTGQWIPVPSLVYCQDNGLLITLVLLKGCSGILL
jgi:hypothetical protein